MIRLFPEYKPGSNITILNTIYHAPYRYNNEWISGAITLIAKDANTGRKLVTTIEDPKYEFYICPEEHLDELGTEWVEVFPKDKLKLCECPYSKLNYYCADLLEVKAQYSVIKQAPNASQEIAKLIHGSNRLFRSNMNISDFYRYKFGQTYLNQPCAITKGYLDIEVDAAKGVSDFPEHGDCPINAMTFIDHNAMISYTFILEDRSNPQYYEFKELIETDKQSLEDEIWCFIIQSMGGNRQKIEKYNLQDLRFVFLTYKEEEEINMLVDFFTVINKSEVDFALGWNLVKFDLPYMIDRIKVLGYDPANVICDPSFKRKTVDIRLDMVRKDNYHLRADAINISSKTTYVDQLLQFAGRRKSKIGSFPSFKLNTIASLVAGIHKLDYTDVTRNLSKLPMLNYKRFVIYNIIDVINQICIEESEKDIDYMLAMALETNTRYSKLYKPSISIYNETCKIYENELGLICGNNINLINPQPKVSYEGAYVSEPRMLGDYAKIRIGDTPIMVCDNVADEDFTSMYPSEAMNFNMSRSTMIGRINILEQVRPDEDYLFQKAVAINEMGKVKDSTYSAPKFNRSGSFVEDYQSQNWLIFGQRWLSLMSYKELMDYVLWYYTKYKQTYAPMMDSLNQWVTQDPTIPKVPWDIKTEYLFNDELMFNRERVPFTYRVPITDEARDKVNDHYKSVKMY